MRRKGKRKIIAVYPDNLETLKIIPLGSFLSLAVKIVALVLGAPQVCGLDEEPFCWVGWLCVSNPLTAQEVSLFVREASGTCLLFAPSRQLLSFS